MSNKTQLQTNNTALASLTDRVLAAKDIASNLPDAGSSGSGGVETCTVEVVSNLDYNSLIIGATILDENGNPQAHDDKCYDSGGYLGSITIENVVVGSAFCVFEMSGSAGFPQMIGMETICSSSANVMCKITASAGSTARITFTSIFG